MPGDGERQASQRRPRAHSTGHGHSGGADRDDTPKPPLSARLQWPQGSAPLQLPHQRCHHAPSTEFVAYVRRLPRYVTAGQLHNGEVPTNHCCSSTCCFGGVVGVVSSTQHLARMKLDAQPSTRLVIASVAGRSPALSLPSPRALHPRPFPHCPVTPCFPHFLCRSVCMRVVLATSLGHNASHVSSLRTQRLRSMARTRQRSCARSSATCWQRRES